MTLQVLLHALQGLCKGATAEPSRRCVGAKDDACGLWLTLEKVHGATRSGATGLRASERKSSFERVSERIAKNL